MFILFILPVPDLEILVDCNEDSDCPKNLPTCNDMVSATPSGKKGFCVFQKCQINTNGYTNDRNCPTLGNECTTGSLSGRCSGYGDTCEYEKLLILAKCGKEKIFDSYLPLPRGIK